MDFFLEKCYTTKVRYYLDYIFGVRVWILARGRSFL